jgi:hypothetical protein
MTRILWNYDEASGTVSALPASPLLLPALIAFGLLCIAQAIAKLFKIGRPLPWNFDERLYAKNKKRYNYLLYKKYILEQELSLTEWYEFEKVLPYPPWGKPGERWTY